MITTKPNTTEQIWMNNGLEAKEEGKQMKTNTTGAFNSLNKYFLNSINKRKFKIILKAIIRG